MRTYRYIYIIGIVVVLAIVACGLMVNAQWSTVNGQWSMFNGQRSMFNGQRSITHDEVRAINERVLEKAIGSPDSALMMIERLRAGDFSVIDTTGASLQWNGPLPDYRCDYLRAKVYAQTLEGMWLDSAIIIGERLMTTDAARDDLAYRQDVLEMLINACRQHRDDELTIHWSAQLIDLCRQNGDETEALRTEADLGLMLSGIGRADEGLAKIDSVLSLLSGKRKFNEFDATIIALKRKINVLKNLESVECRVDSVEFATAHDTSAPGTAVANSKLSTLNSQLKSAQQMLDLMADYEQHPDEYHDGTYREPPEHLRPVYIDFYRAQAYMFMVEACAKLSLECRVDSVEFATALDYSASGRAVANSKLSTLNSPLRKAKEYLSLFEHTDYAKTFQARKDMAPTYGLLGEYDKMLAIHDEDEASLRAQGDTVCAEYATILRDRAMAAEAQGRHAEANSLHNAYETLTATLNDRLLQSKANLYAARFHAAEQQRELERHKATAKYLGIVGGCIAIAAMLAMFFAAYVVHKRRIVDKKNRALVKQIEEAAEYRKRVESLTPGPSGLTPGPIPADAPTHSLSPWERGVDTSAVDTSADKGNHSPLPGRGAGGEAVESDDDDASLFTHIHQVIKEKKLYLDPQFDRQAAIDHFHLTKERIGAAFAKGSEHASITDYINRLRLDHARELMTDRPEMSIDEVATSSGFAVRRTFSRLFKDKFGLTPTEYRSAYLSGMDAND